MTALFPLREKNGVRGSGAQGTEGGGQVGWMARMALLPMVVDATGSTPVLAAGGIADGRGLVAALALGAQGFCLELVSLLRKGRRSIQTSNKRCWTAMATLHRATAEGDASDALLLMGQDAGLICDIPAAQSCA